MKVLLISENRCRDNLIPYPLGMSYLAGAVMRAGHRVSGLDLMFSDRPGDDTAAAVRDFAPDLVGLSIRNIDNQDGDAPVLYLSGVREIADAARSETDAPVVLGGAGFTIFPLECLDYLGLELGIVGEGEESFPALIDCLESGGDPCDLPGVALSRGGVSRLNPATPYRDFENSPPPDRTVFDVERYGGETGGDPALVANLQSRRGCHMKCIYCSSPMVEGRRVRMREPRSVADELLSLRRDHDIESAWIVDSLFNYPAEYAENLCREIIDREPGVCWTCTFNPFSHEHRLFEILRRAGCSTLSIGNESGSEDMLSALRKGFGKEDIAATVGEAKRNGFRINCFLLLGGPGENRGSVEESVAFLSELDPDMVSVRAGIRIYPGCELHRIAIDEGVVAPGQNLLEPTFYISAEVRGWLHDYLVEVCAEREGWRI